MTVGSEAQGVTVGLYGKHPAFGDFVTAGLSETAQSTLEKWLNKVMPAVRDGWGENWGPLFDASPLIRFWFGAALTGEHGPLWGVMAPSRDKVGRRFPLIAAVSGAAQPAPVQGGDQTAYDAIIAAVRNYERTAGTGAGDYATHLRSAIAQLIPPPADPMEPAFWAARADGDLDRLWHDVAAVDHARATAGRSYLWCDGPGGGAVHVTRSLPEANVLAWLMSDAVRGQVPPAVPMPEPDKVTAPPAVPMPGLDDATHDMTTEKTASLSALKETTVSPADDPQAMD